MGGHGWRRTNHEPVALDLDQPATRRMAQSHDEANRAAVGVAIHGDCGGTSLQKQV